MRQRSGAPGRARQRRLLVGLALGLAGIGACDRGSVSPPAQGAAPVPASGPVPGAAAVSPKDEVGCRVTQTLGRARSAAGALVARGQKLSSRSWLELDGGAVVHLRHTRSGRELSLTGPGRVLACVDGREEVLVGSGTVRTQATAGTRPGAQVLVGTPFGTFRYADARASVAVGASELSASVDAGRLWLSPPGTAADELTLDHSAAFRRDTSGRIGAEAATRLCERAAGEARERAASLLAGGKAGFGDRAAAHVRARKQARSACATATAAALGEQEGTDLEARLAEISRFEALFRAVPGSAG